MPLFQIGYRRYEGERTPHAMRWLPIARSGLTIAWRSKLLRRLVFVSFLPFLYFGWVFFLIGRVTDPSVDVSDGAMGQIAREIFGSQIVERLHSDPGAIRSAVWAIVFAMFGTYFQLLMGGLVATIAGPRLVANDLRTRSFLIYFARPVSRLDYVVGKAGVLVVLLGAVTLLPSLLLYSLSILFSPSLGTLVQTLPVAFTTVAVSLGTIVPAALIVLVLSSLTRQPRFAAAAWIVICLFGPLAHSILQQTRGLRDNGWTFLMSLPHTLRALQLGMYDVSGRVAELGTSGDVGEVVESLTSDNSPTRAAIWLAFVSILSVLILLRRVDAPTRI